MSCSTAHEKFRGKHLVEGVIAALLFLLVGVVASMPDEAFAATTLKAASSASYLELGQQMSGTAESNETYEFQAKVGYGEHKAVRFTLTWDNNTNTTPKVFIWGEGLTDDSWSSYYESDALQVDYSKKSFSYICKNASGYTDFAFKFYGKTDFTLKAEDVSVAVGGISAKSVLTHESNHAYIQPSFTPANANVYSLKFESDDTAVATVYSHDDYCTVTGKTPGSTFVTIMDELSGKSVKVPVTVKPTDSGKRPIAFGEVANGVSSYMGQTFSFNLAHATAVRLTITWGDDLDSEDGGSKLKVSDFDPEGYSPHMKKLKLSEHSFTCTKTLSAGTHTFEIEGENRIPYTVQITDASVYPNAINSSDITAYVGKAERINPTFSPSNTNAYDLTYSSNAPSVASVDKNGTVTGVKPGKARITITDRLKGAQKTIVVTVKPAPISRVGKAKRTMAVGKKLKLRCNSKVKSPVLSWKSSNKKVATVDKSGKVTAKHLGWTTISATSKYGKTVKWTVYVTSQTINRLDDGFYIIRDYTRHIKNYRKAKYSNSNKSVLGNSIDGIVTHKKGKSTITLKVGGKKYNLTVYVQDRNRMKQYAHDYFNRRLKNPESLVINSDDLYVSTNDKCVYYVNYSAMNGFGGYTRDELWFVFDRNSCTVRS